MAATGVRTSGFYGGVNYGFGYIGVGYAGGRWNGNQFAYNASVNNVTTTVVHNTGETTGPWSRQQYDDQ